MRYPLSMVEPVPMPRFAVVDLETSGFTPNRHRILQLGMVTVEADGTVLDEWSTLVKLRWPWQRVGPTHVHHITRSQLRGAPPLDDVLTEFEQRLDGAVFTAHNAAFDSGFLLHAASRHKDGQSIEQKLSPQLCTLQMSRLLDPQRERSHRLGDLCERYDIALDRPHDALNDAAATAAVLPHLLDAHHITSVEQLQPFYSS